MDYCPPSDPEDNDYDTENFELYGPNQAHQVLDFHHDDDRSGAVTYTDLRPHVNPAPGIIEPPLAPDHPEPPNVPANLDQDMEIDAEGAAHVDTQSSDSEAEIAAQTPSTPQTPEPENPGSTPPTSPPDSPFNSDYDDDTDIEVDVLDNDDDFGIPLQRPHSRLMVNNPKDVEDPEDYEIGWEWIETDTGPLIAPYTGFRQCLLNPAHNKPEDFFNALFEDAMFERMAEMTNLYAHNRIQSK